MGRVFLTGDLHGAGGLQRFHPRWFFQGEGLGAEDLVVVLGDFELPAPGGGWTVPAAEALRWLEEAPWTTLFLDGNHEDFAVLEGLPREERFGGVVGVLGSRVFHLRRGQVFVLGGWSCFVMGGAVSLDREVREPRGEWSPLEVPSEEEWRRGEEALAGVRWAVDGVLSHECPQSVAEVLGAPGEDPVRRRLEGLAGRLAFRGWFFGHHHRDREVVLGGRAFRCVYRDMLDLEGWGRSRNGGGRVRLLSPGDSP